MKGFADTSFLCALYRKQENTSRAIVQAKKLGEPMVISSLVVFEFRQAARLQVFRFSKDRSQGFSQHITQQMFVDLQTDINSGTLLVAPVEWPDVHSVAEQLSAKFTPTKGHRTLDILHVATAMQLKGCSFLTFDINQSALAKAAGLKILS